MKDGGSWPNSQAKKSIHHIHNDATFAREVSFELKRSTPFHHKLPQRPELRYHIGVRSDNQMCQTCNLCHNEVPPLHLGGLGLTGASRWK